MSDDSKALETIFPASLRHLCFVLTLLFVTACLDIRVATHFGMGETTHFVMGGDTQF